MKLCFVRLYRGWKNKQIIGDSNFRLIKLAGNLIFQIWNEQLRLKWGVMGERIFIVFFLHSKFSSSWKFLLLLSWEMQQLCDACSLHPTSNSLLILSIFYVKNEFKVKELQHSSNGLKVCMQVRAKEMRKKIGNKYFSGEWSFGSWKVERVVKIWNIAKSLSHSRLFNSFSFIFFFFIYFKWWWRIIWRHTKNNKKFFSSPLIKICFFLIFTVLLCFLCVLLEFWWWLLLLHV